MEESLSEVEAHQSFRSPPRRRRSTFFERRESIVPQPMSENKENINICKINSEEEKRQLERTRYHEKLMTEKDQWKMTVKERRNKYHDLRQQYQMAIKAPSTSKMAYSTLTKEDIEFVKAKHNISKLNESQSSFHKGTQLSNYIIMRATEVEDVTVKECEAKLNKITEHILEHSTLVPKSDEET